MAGINYRKHSQCLKEFKRLNESAGKRQKNIQRGSWLLWANKCCPLQHRIGGVPGGSARETPQAKRGVDKTLHGEEVLSRASTRPRAGLSKSLLLHQLTKSTPPKPPPPRR